MLLWRRGTSVLTAGPLKITRDDRFKIVSDYNLQISNVKTQDAGDYICQIGDQETRDQVHTVEILGNYNSRRSILFEHDQLVLLIIYVWISFSSTNTTSRATEWSGICAERKHRYIRM